MKTFYLTASLFLFVQCSDAVRELVHNPRSPAACNTSTTFACTSEPGKCIPNSWKCDGDIDCLKGEDEEKCSDTCPDDEFKCGGDQEKSGGTKAINGCIPKKWRCDGEFDCDDHSDEKDCPEIKCKEDQFKCSEFDGQFTLCIPNSWKCDGQNDCASGADEEGCHDRVCTDNDFKCRNGVCIFKSWTCDGEDDCGDGSDEDKEVCEKEQKTACNLDRMFRCESGNGCIPREWMCDGESDCRDHSDEENCTVATAASCSHKTEFACKTGKFCISSQWKCDGEIDCPDGSDETECNPKTCGADERSCSSENPKLPAATLCFPETFWCNGREDCPNGEDEMNCTKLETKKCGDYEYECPGSNNLCIQRDKLCSTNKENCLSDDFCSKDIKDCTPNSNFCKKTDSYVKNFSVYQCAKGFKAVNGVCEDIDECKEIPGVCDQLCQNLPGSYRCGCHRGYKLSQTKGGLIPTKCRAIGGDPLVLLSNRATIRQFDIVTNVHEALVQSPGSAVAMDFHLSNNTIIWSDITQQKILMCKVQNGNGSARKSFILDGNNCKPSNQFVVFEGEVHTPDGLAIDWVHNLLFWTDGGLDQISVMNLDTRQKKVLFTDKLEEPRAIAVDPEFGLIFWTDWGQEAKIERAGMDGKNRTVIMQGEQVKWPNGLALDLLEKRVYWADAKVKSILSCDYYGNNIKTVLHSHSYLRHPFSLAVFEDRVYFTDWEHDGVISVNKFTGGDVQKLMGKVSTPMTVRIYHKQAQPEHSNKCSNEGESPCAKERMCLPTGAIRGKDSTQEKPYSGRPFSCVCQGGLGDGLEETAECLAEVIAGNPGFSLSTMLLLAVLAIFVVGGYAFYRNRKGSSFTALNFDNPVYRRTVEPDMNDPFSDPFRAEGTVNVSGPTQVEQPSRLVIHDEGENDRHFT
ncbi:unnamed protein product, partial [Mesorhabditis belari]|uniref:EGF-like domain-containing protein n=1 Tax=Mesorhabditis belari TaxID=2138241 RepID=A0AAF3FK84_9BILA